MVFQNVDKLDESGLVYSFFIWLGSKTGLLISVPGASLSAGPALSLLVALCSCGVSPVQLIPQDFEKLPRTCPGTMEMR
jgi:hypothetical protein